MGRFIEEKKIVNNYVDAYLSSSKKYAKYIDGSPSFTTYYSKDLRRSTEDVGLGSVLELVGTQSPLKYNKLENFPIFAFDEIQPDQEYDEETGLSTEIEGTAVILPGTIRPLPDDYFLISYKETNKMFRVTNVEFSNVSNKSYYKITFSITSSSVGIIDERQVTNTYETLFDNIGTEKKVLVLIKDYLLIEKIDNLYESIKNKYINLFLTKRFNSVIYEDIYDPYLSYFIASNKLFVKDKTFMSNIFIDDLLRVDILEYERTIFYALDIKDPKYIELLDFYKERISNSIFSLYPEKYYSSIYIPMSNDLTLSPFEDGFLECIKTYTDIKSVENRNLLEQIIILFLCDDIDNQTFFEIINKIRLEKSIEYYIISPCVLFILKNIKNKIINK